MSDFTSVLKSFFYCCLIIFLLQIRVSGETLEHKAYKMVYNEKWITTLNSVAHGGVLAIERGKLEIQKLWNKDLSSKAKNSVETFDR